MKVPDTLMRASSSLTAREARGLTRRQLAAEKASTTAAEIWLLEKLEANLVYRFYILSRILDMNDAEPNLPEVYQQVMDFCAENDQEGGTCET